MASIVAALLSGHASAWTATSYDKTHGGSYTHIGADTPEEAKHKALKGCRAKAPDTKCVELGSPVHGTAIVIAMGTKRKADDAIYHIGNPCQAT